MSNVTLRPAQAEVLTYRGGRLAISAVPGSGKTFTLTELATRLIAEGRIDALAGQQILIVTYLNASADHFKNRLRARLTAEGLPPVGFDARTLHSMALEILKLVYGDSRTLPAVIDETQSGNFLSRAIDGWKQANAELWAAYEPDDSPQARVRWRTMIDTAARAFIRRAKNARHRPEAILARLATVDQPTVWAFTRLFAEIYARYQEILARQGALDYDDQVWEAVDAVERSAELAHHLRQRWPYILEDEAQDSVPLQEELLNLLVGVDGNLVRVGDPNQAITTTFTAADPRFFNAFLQRPDVDVLTLPNSGRNAPQIFSLANHLVNWVTQHHPVPEVRAHTFRRQMIRPTPAGDTQPNPSDHTANIVVQVYAGREEAELPDVVRLANAYTQKFPDRTVAILVPTNSVGYTTIELLDARGIKHYDSLLRGGLRERQVAAVLHALLALLADPLRGRLLKDAYDALRDITHPATAFTPEHPDRFYALLGSVQHMESLLFPADRDELVRALPRGVASEEDVQQLASFAAFLRRVFALRPLAIDALTMRLGDELFVPGSSFRESDLAIAYQLATTLQSWQDLEPAKRLPDLVAEMASIASGRRALGGSTGDGDEGFRPRPGRITLTTQHKAKGLEFDAVFLVGIDNFWVPGDLDAPFQGVSDIIGGDPTAEVTAELMHLMSDTSDAPGAYPNRTPTEAAHIDVISERLRLLYVGITRARRFLQISRSRTTRDARGQERPADETAVLAELADFVQAYKAQHGLDRRPTGSA